MVSYFSGFKDTIGKNAGIMELITEHCDHETVTVDTTTPNDLFHDQNVPEFIEFLSVDTEGSELEIFESIDFGKYKFGVIDFEHNEDEHSRSAIGEILLKNGYVPYKKLRINDVYINHKTWLDNEYAMWVDALGKSSVHDFKEHPMVQRMLGNIDPIPFLELISTPIPTLISDIDNIGRRKPEVLSGTGLRMLYYAEQVMKLLPTSIVEVGGGVGQFYATLRALGYSGEYYIYDLPAVKVFQDKYLAEVEGIAGLSLSQKKTERPDFCVSFHALGEFDDELKEWYIKNVVKKCKHGFVIWNPHSGASEKIGFKCKVADEQVSPGAKRLTW
jgi:Methyltransferase FkbM domain